MNKMKQIAMGALIMVSFFSCRSVEKIAVVEKVKPMGVNRVVANVQDNAFDFSSLEVKRLTVGVENDGKKVSIRGNLKMEKDKFILIYLSKLNMSVARVLLKPNEVQLVNYLDKTTFKGSYEYLSALLNADLNYHTIQSIITNDVFSAKDVTNSKGFKKYSCRVDSGAYVVRSEKKRKISGLMRKEKKLNRYMKKKDELDLLVQTLLINPQTFKVQQVSIKDLNEDREFKINFEHFVDLEGQFFPDKINANFKSTTSSLKLKIGLSRFVLNKPVSMNFNIPEKFKKIETLN
ncbi:DUF4292 domain-containing protein [Puteibacter caeruleilacunae]|nr:DUF4292 domain-containing protein [Puteibacter caeruleilacunae]